MSDRRQGRPCKVEEQDSRNKILQAAEELFSHLSFDRVSLREIADRAGVDVSLIPYYFKNKKNLYYAFLQNSLGQVLNQMQLLSESANLAQGESLKLYIDGMLQIFGEKPWLPQFIFREILVGQQDLQKFYVTNFARHTGRYVPLLIDRQPELVGINREYAALSLLSMLLFPFIAQSLAAPAFGIVYDEAFRKRLGDHIYLVMMGRRGDKLGP